MELSKENVFHKFLNLFTARPVALLLGAIGLELVLVVAMRLLNAQGIVNVVTLTYVVQLAGFFARSMFFVVILAFRRFELRFVLMSLFGILALLFYSFLMIHLTLTGGRTTLVDLNVIFASLALAMAIYVSVDQTVAFFPKPILVGTTLLVLAFNSYLSVMWQFLIYESIATNYDTYLVTAFYVMTIVYHSVWLLWTIPQIYLIRKIDYM